LPAAAAPAHGRREGATHESVRVRAGGVARIFLYVGAAHRAARGDATSTTAGRHSVPPYGRDKRLFSASTIGCWPLLSLRIASSGPNQPARSTSGNCAIFPDFGGHSIVNRLLCSSAGSQSPSAAQAITILPLGCLNSPSATNWPSTIKPVSS